MSEFDKSGEFSPSTEEEDLETTRLIKRGINRAVFEDDPDKIRGMVTLLQAMGGSDPISIMLAWRYGIPTHSLDYSKDPRLADLWQQALESGGLDADLAALVVSGLIGAPGLKGSDLDTRIRTHLKAKLS